MANLLSISLYLEDEQKKLRRMKRTEWSDLKRVIFVTDRYPQTIFLTSNSIRMLVMLFVVEYAAANSNSQ